jgi:predicted alpha-1,2-mannosidase
MKRITFLLIVVVFSITGCFKTKSPADFVDPFIGTGGHGHTFPGATMPFGMVQLSPDTRIDSWDGCSGYHYSDSTILGFSHTHLSGTGVGDYGDIRFMPTVGELILDPGTENDPESGYRSRFSHENEEASPGYYSVLLEDYNIDVELTATERVGFHKYEFPETDEAHIVIDLVEGVTSDRIEYLEVQFLSDVEIAGIRRTDGWADDQRVYFYAIFSKPFDNYGVLDGRDSIKTREKRYGDQIKAWIDYSTEKDEEVLVRVGISSVSIEGARKNLLEEIPDWNFDKIRKEGTRKWNKQLSKIKVKGDKTRKQIFYTALYHSFIAPNIFMDVDGSYRAHDGKNYKTDKFNMYTVFSLWDTFRATHPLFTIIEQARTVDFIQSMLDMYEHGGLLPVWELAGNETNCMIGYHSIPVITDAYIKGIDDYSLRKVYDAMRKSATQDHFGLDAYRKYGYIPADKDGSSVSKTLEYAYDDWCIARMARELNREKEYTKYLRRAQYYKNIFDAETGFMRGKRNSMFTEPFDPTEVNFMLTEANTWQYNFFVPQDISGLMNLLGGKEAFAVKLDDMFSATTDLSGRHQSDITGLIGQYAHGNEPSHHMAYLYNYAEQPWKTQKVVHDIMTTQYSDKTDGLCGNEDCGQMSAWYVLSAMGFYAVTPGDTIYAIGTPEFRKAEIRLENGNTFKIKAENLSNEHFYIKSAKLNGKPYNKSFISHQDIMKGGEIVFEMSAEPDKQWGTGEGNYPVSEIKEHLITPVPYIEAESHAFNDNMTIALRNIYPDAMIYYTLDGEDPEVNPDDYVLYKEPITINKTSTIKAYAIIDGLTRSKITEGVFVKIPGNREIYLNSEYSTQYTGGGKIALIDGLHGGLDFTTAGWQGYYGIDLDAVIDLGKTQRVNKITVEFLQNQRSWIFMPEKVDYYISKNGKDYRHVGTVENTIAPTYQGAIIDQFSMDKINRRARYVKVVAKNMGLCPDWHPGAGTRSWIFVDEITVE